MSTVIASIAPTPNKVTDTYLTVVVGDDPNVSDCALHWGDITAADVPASLKLRTNANKRGVAEDSQWVELWDSLEQCNAKEVLFVDSDAGKEDKEDDSAVAFQPFSQVTPSGKQTRGAVAVVGIAVTAISATISVVQWIINQNWDNHQVKLH